MLRIKRAAALVIFDSKGKVLFAKRGPKKWPFPNTLSLPSSYIEKGENAKEKVAKAVKRKLGVKVKILDVLGRKIGRQTGNFLIMTEFIAKIKRGKIKPNKTDYTKAIFLEPKATLQKLEKERKLGFCTAILLQKLNKNPKLYKKYKNET